MKASEWWAERLAWFLGQSMMVEHDNREIYQRYAAICKSEMVMSAAIENVKERTNVARPPDIV